MLPQLLEGFAMCLAPLNLLLVALGTLLGIIVGAIPALNSPMAIAMLLPFTFGWPTIPAMLVILGIYVGTKVGGAFTAILLRTPGTPAASATVLDGYAMAEKGEAGLAMGTAILASTYGGICGWIVCVLAATQLARVAVKVGPPDLCMIAMLGLVLVPSLCGKSMIKGLISSSLGLIFSAIGLDQISGIPRLTFGSFELLGGIPFLPAIVGLFAIAVVLSDINKPVKTELITKEIKVRLPSWQTFKKIWKALNTGLFIGLGVGAVPGIGADVAVWLSYAVNKKSSKYPEKFGTGIVEGVVAAEVADNGVTGGAPIPMLTLGIPGDASTALMLAALTLHGLRPGPLFFKESPELAYGILSGLLLANIFMFLISIAMIKIFIKILQRERSVIFPLVLVCAIIGSFADTNTLFSVQVAILFGLLGYFMERYDFSIPALVLGLILGPIIERNLRRALMISRGSFMIFITSPVSLVCILIILFSLSYSVYRSFKKELGVTRES